jgi:predicted AlkP superfamily pyrophosphatase or phosphodiesterase
MAEHVVLLSIPGLREKDVAAMPNLRELTAGGEIADLVPSFPCVTCPVQANMTTGKLPAAHGVVANGFYWRDRRRVEMWTSPND